MADINTFFVQFVQSALGVICGIGLLMMAFCGLASLIAVWGYRAEQSVVAPQPLPELAEYDCFAHVGLFCGF